MPTQVTNYQCPACTGPLHFSAETGKLTCDYCGSAYDVAEIEALYAQKEAEAAAAKEAADAKAEAAKADAADDGGWDTSGLSSDWGADADGLRVYGCPSCGAELICDETTAATSCPYCGNPTVVPGQFSGALKPEFVLPFRMTKDDAVRALRAHYRGKPFLPRSFTAGNHIEEIQGVYVPFWLFDGGAEGEVDYKAANSRTYKLPGFVYFFFSFSDKFHKACHIQIHFHRAAPVKDTFFFYDILIFRQSRLDQHLAQTEYRHTQVIAHICQFFSSKEIVKQLCSGDSCAPAVLHQTGM